MSINHYPLMKLSILNLINFLINQGPPGEKCGLGPMVQFKTLLCDITARISLVEMF